jgi:heavy metal efflux system protein
VEEAIEKVEKQVKLPAGYHIDWAGEYEASSAPAAAAAIIIPLTLLLIFMILYSMFNR